LKSHFNTKISPEQAKQLKQYNNMLNPYANLKDGDAIDWEFDPAGVEEIPDHFNKDKTKMQFKVYDPNLDSEFIWQVSKKWAALVTPFLTQGKTFLHIERHGSTVNNTEYRVYPVGEEPQE
jgi:hypothetical protein